MKIIILFAILGMMLFSACTEQDIEPFGERHEVYFYKYFMDEEFKFLPDTIKEDLKRICVYMAEKLNCTFLVGFDDNGDVYFETIKHEGDFDFDEIGAELEIKRLQKEELELFRAMEL